MVRKRFLFVTFVFLLLIIIGNFSVLAQPTNYSTEPTIVKRYKDYFSSDRKSIHLHLNKTTFASGEHIWFSTYIFNKKQNRISLEDEYVYIDLLDNEGKVIDSKTIWYDNGHGMGEIYLDMEMVSGKYFLQAYTMAMNNFPEDDSAVYPIKIINFESRILPVDYLASDDINIEIQPESGALVQDVFGTCGFLVKDSAGNAIVPDSVLLETGQGHKKSNVSINSMGAGKFSLTPRKGIQHVLTVYKNNKIFNSRVPGARQTGYTVSVDHNFAKKQLLVTIATNRSTWKKGMVKLSLLVHKDGNIFASPVQIRTSSFTGDLVIPYHTLFPGINTLTLVGDDHQVLAERLVFNQPASVGLRPQLLKINRNNDSLTIYIKNNSGENKSSLNRASVSVLPYESLADKDYKNITSSFYLDGYVSLENLGDIQELSYLEKDLAKNDLDAFLLIRGGGRYRWKYILNPNFQPPKKTHYTSSLKGYANIFESENDSLSVLLYSVSNGIFETTPLDQEKKFEFNEMPLAKDSKVTLTLLDRSGKPVYANFFFTIQPTAKSYRYPYRPVRATAGEIVLKSQDHDVSLLKKVELLDEVTVVGNQLKRERFFGKFFGRKVDSTLTGKVILGNYIKSMGYRGKYIDPSFSDPRRAGSYQLVRTCGGSTILFPSISFDGAFSRYITDYTQIRMDQIDEIYFLKESRCDPGLFVVFSNELYGNEPLPEIEKDTKEFIVDKGHDIPKPFVRPSYYSLNSDSFERYGIISWLPDVVSNEHGVISFKIPYDSQKNFKIILEGYGGDGEYLSQSLDIDLANSMN